MTHDKKSGVYFLCTFRDLKQLCGHAGVSGYLLFALFALFALSAHIYPLYFSLFFFPLSFRTICSIFTSFWPCLIPLKMLDVWRRVYSRCLPFFLYV